VILLLNFYDFDVFFVNLIFIIHIFFGEGARETLSTLGEEIDLEDPHPTSPLRHRLKPHTNMRNEFVSERM